MAYTSIDVLHDEKQSLFGLEATVKCCEKRMLGCQNQDALLRHRAINVVVLDNHVFLQHFDRVNFIRVSFSLGKHDLAEATFTQYFDEIEIVDAHSVSADSTFSCRSGIPLLIVGLLRGLHLIGRGMFVRCASASVARVH